MTVIAPSPVAATPVVPERRIAPSVDARALSAWVMPIALILYLGFRGGGYAATISDQVGIAVWWCVIVACGWALLPATALSRLALGAMLTFGAFTAWTALGIGWSISPGRSVQDLALISAYFGILVLAVSIHRDRAQAIRHTVPAVAVALSILAAFSVATRLWPSFIPSAVHIAQTNQRLSWPLDYWNALAALTAMGLALLLGVATSARRLAVQAVAAAVIPIVALCGALTQSRGGVLEAAAAVVVWVALSSGRLAKLATLAVTGLASTAVIALAFSDRAIRTAQTGALEHHQAAQLVLVLAVVCVGTGAVQAGIGALTTRVRFPRFPRVSTANRVGLSLIGLVLCVVIAVAAGVPHHLSHAWADFKNPAFENSANHLSASSGEGRYQYWVAALHSAAGHPLTGSGPGTFQLDWLPRARIDSYVVNAHSLYVETYAELGVVGVILLGAFIVLCLGAAIRAALSSSGAERTRAAAVTAALAAFFVGAAFDWLWQMPVLVAAVLVLSAATLAPQRRVDADAKQPLQRPSRLPMRRVLGLAAVLVGVAGLVAVVYPLSVNDAVANSQAAVNAGNLPRALSDARHAVSLEPGSGTANLQLALVLERDRDFPAALDAAQSAVRHDQDNWVAWLTLSRISAENGAARASLAAYRQARSLNPESPLFDS